MSLKLSDAAKAFLADKGFDPDMGARPLARTIQKFVEDPVAEELLKAESNEGAVIEVDHEKDAAELKINVVKKKEPRKKKDTSAPTPPVDKPSDN
jgi:ATP-dependent Clp protease ATP-binding subunit ClpC